MPSSVKCQSDESVNDILHLSCHNHILYLLLSFLSHLAFPSTLSFCQKSLLFMEASCSCVCKFLSLVSSYLPLESQRNAGWKGPPEPSPSWKQGCLHRGTWLLRDTSWRGKKSLRMEIHKLSASWGSHALSFSPQAFSPYSFPEFPLIQFLFLLYISYYNLLYWQNRECVCFYELVHLAVFLSAKRGDF